jgi:hypothetical protein
MKNRMFDEGGLSLLVRIYLFIAIVTWLVVFA